MSQSNAPISEFVRHECSTCHDVYYIHRSVDKDVDNGHCLSCRNEIATLEGWFNQAEAQ